jgi:hypothetical protein
MSSPSIPSVSSSSPVDVSDTSLPPLEAPNEAENNENYSVDDSLTNNLPTPPPDAPPSVSKASSSLFVYHPLPSYSPPTLVPTIDESSFSPDQKLVLAAIRHGRSVFFTGSAGTGKVNDLSNCFV